MGNCIQLQSTMQWGDEEWDSTMQENQLPKDNNMHVQDYNNGKKVGKIVEHHGKSRSVASTPTTATEVKIKITKKQLEELLGRVDVKELSVEQVLVQLMDVSSKLERHEQGWKPVLQTIPE